jgi:hypothetical protein
MSILRADSIRDRAGTGAPDFPNGLTGNVTGTATTATNAQGITGTPNITVGTVTGTDATFSGNLTVQGTTTTIDTAVTAVDSLAVDGNVTALGNLGVGTATAGNALHVYKNGDGQTPVKFETSNATGKLRFYNDSNGWSIDSEGELRFVGGRTGSGAPVSLHITSGGAAIFKGGLAEKYNSISGNLASNTNHSIFNGNVIAFAVGDTGTSLTINFTDVHATLSQHEFCSFTVILDPGGAGKITTVQIDGQSPAGGLKWSGGSAPSAGASGYDVYTFALQKYGTAANNYIVYGAATNYD